MLHGSNVGHRRGSALLPVLLVALAVSGMSAAIVSTSLYRQSAARAEHERERAFEAAMSGLDVALYELQEASDLGTDGVGTASGETEGCDWSVTVTPAFTGPGEYALRATGRHGPMREGIELVVTSEESLRVGLYGRDGITMSGSFGTDSYDSTLGTYASQVVGDHAGDLGSVVSNADITAGGGVIHGDATPGPAFQVLGDPANVTGSTAPAPEPLDFPPYVYAPTVAATSAWSGPGTITAGTYRFTSLGLSGGDVLVIEGAVSISIDEDIVASGGSRIVVQPGASLTLSHGTGKFVVSGGGIVNETEQPGQVILRSATASKIEFSGGSDFYGVIYAPEAEFVSSGGSHLFGAVLGRLIEASGDGRLHFDESLRLRLAGGTEFTVKSARRVAAEGP